MDFILDNWEENGQDSQGSSASLPNVGYASCYWQIRVKGYEQLLQRQSLTEATRL